MALKSTNRQRQAKEKKTGAKKSATKKKVVKRTSVTVDEDSARKRVSFAAKLEHSRLLEEMTGETNVNTPDAPNKGILKRKRTLSHNEEKENVAQTSTSTPTSVYSKSAKKLHSTDDGGISKGKMKRVITVKKSVKEKLLKMDKKERKAFLLKLKEKHKPHIHIAQKAKQLWEIIRSSKCPAPKKEETIAQIMSLVKGSAAKLVYAHDTSRVIQCLMKLPNENVRNELFEELKPELLRMTKSPYAKFFVLKILKNGNTYQKNILMQSFYGHCAVLLRNVSAATVLETAYNDHANAEQRNNIVSDFYGKEFILFRNDQTKTATLQQIAKNSPAKIPPIMKNLEEVLENVVQKETLRHSLTHKLLLDFLTYCTKEQRSNMIETLKDHLPEFSHTREGSRAAMICVWHASVKERKAIVKSFKDLAIKSAQDEFSRRVLFAIFDSVDDTILVNKFITEELSNNIADLIYHKHGVWTLHYLVHPRHYQVFGKGLIQLLREGDNNETSKKLHAERYSQFYECIKKSLFTFMAANMKEMLTNKVSAVLVLDALEPNDPKEPLQRQVDKEDKEACFRAIAEIVGEEFIPHEIEAEPHIIQSGCGRYVLMKLLKAEKSQTDVKLSDFLADLPRQHLASFVAINNGCFVLLNMAQSGSGKALKAVTKAVNATVLKQHENFVGAKLLKEELLIA
jgi:pumilio family protein 6